VLDQALLDQCLSLTPPDMLAYTALLDCFGPQAFLDLLEARRLVWLSLRADAPRRKEGNVWTECERRPDWCHSNWLFRRALAGVLAQAESHKARNAPYADFDDAFAGALEQETHAVRRTVCEICRRKMVERLSWFVDSARLFDIVRNVMGSGLLDASSNAANGAPPTSAAGVQQPASVRTGKGKGKAKAKAANGNGNGSANDGNRTPTVAGYMWNAARGLPVEGAAQHREWEKFMSPEPEPERSEMGNATEYPVVME